MSLCQFLLGSLLAGVLGLGVSLAAADPSLPDSKRSGTAVAEPKTKDALKVPAGRTPPAKPVRHPLTAVTPEREAAAMTFVGQHHPELVELLIFLRENQPPQYEAAIRDLFRASERLAQVRERDEQRYSLELAAWKLQSRVQLLSARLQMSESEATLKELENTLRQQHELQVTMLRRERERVAERLGKLEEQLHRLESQREAMVEKHLAAVRQTKREAAKGKHDTPRTKASKTKKGAAKAESAPD